MRLYQLMKVIFCMVLLVSITTLIQPVQSTAFMEKIKGIEDIREEINKIISHDEKNRIFSSIFNKDSVENEGLISWLFNLIKQIIELIKIPFEGLSILFSKLASFFGKLQILMDDLISLIDWIVRKAIIAVIISIIIMILEFIQFVLKFIEEINNDTEPDVNI